LDGGYGDEGEAGGWAWAASKETHDKECLLLFVSTNCWWWYVRAVPMMLLSHVQNRWSHTLN